MRYAEKGSVGFGFEGLPVVPGSRISHGTEFLDERNGRQWAIERVIIGSGAPDRSGIALQRVINTRRARPVAGTIHSTELWRVPYAC